MKISSQEFSLLLEAIDTWERGDTSDVLASMVMVGVWPDKEEASAKLEASRTRYDIERRKRQERTIELKYKLLKCRDSVAADEFIGSAELVPQ